MVDNIGPGGEMGLLIVKNFNRGVIFAVCCDECTLVDLRLRA